MDIPPLDGIDETQFKELTAQESNSIPGQREKLRMIQRMIALRLGKRREQVESVLRLKGSGDRAAKDAATSQIQMCTPVTITLPDGRSNLLMGKGGGSEALYHIFVPAHIDTVKVDAPYREEGDRRMVNGGWDMTAAVLNNIALLTEITVPKILQVWFGFTVDEEANSLGAKAIMKDWENWKDVKLVVSSEIGPLVHPPADDDLSPRIIAGRRGRAKFLSTITIDPEKQGHGAAEGLPNSHEAHVEWAWRMQQLFYRGIGLDGHPTQPVQMKHPLLGEEKIDFGTGNSIQLTPGYGHPFESVYRYYLQMVPPNTLAAALYEQQQTAARIATLSEWTEKHGIRHRIVANTAETAYEPFCMPMPEDPSHRHHPAIAITQEMLQRVYGLAPVIDGGGSVADENLYAADLLKRCENGTFAGTNKGVLSIPIRGNNAHNLSEWVSWSDIAWVRHVMRLLLTDPRGYVRLAHARV